MIPKINCLTKILDGFIIGYSDIPLISLYKTFCDDEIFTIQLTGLHKIDNT